MEYRASTSARVVNGRMLKRTDPAAAVPSDSCTSGPQCRPVRHATLKSTSRRAPASAGSMPSMLKDTTGSRPGVARRVHPGTLPAPGSECVIVAAVSARPLTGCGPRSTINPQTGDISIEA